MAKQIKTKQQKAAAAASQSRSKKKKWSKGKVKDKADNVVILSPETIDRINKEMTTAKVITPSILVERYKINCSVARSVLKGMHTEGKIRLVVSHNAQTIYTRAIATADDAADVVEDTSSKGRRRK
ncbi:S25 ribosomal protein [Fonticula alba]|uniref:40S ribosomal protein S25 n=1 Tax=Fonticula alba TaxID=691883 RepID=A0A058ZHH7_FONAL|nr:S25 ribosomal protein [Fonticula alba]KCV73393.1 S25 ribosomal protein [Fonticula alba]|eukprot:XP_009493094.1 S25 ribosomal protein [Fonticula alba]